MAATAGSNTSVYPTYLAKEEGRKVRGTTPSDPTPLKVEGNTMISESQNRESKARASAKRLQFNYALEQPAGGERIPPPAVAIIRWAADRRSPGREKDRERNGTQKPRAQTGARRLSKKTRPSYCTWLHWWIRFTVRGISRMHGRAYLIPSTKPGKGPQYAA